MSYCCKELARKILHAAIERNNVVLLASLAIRGINSDDTWWYQDSKGADTEVHDDYGKRAADYFRVQTSMPPVLIASAIRRYFPANLYTLPFTQPLTGLGYLDDLEKLRKRKVSLTEQTLGLEDGIARLSDGSIALSTVRWAHQKQNKCKDIGSLYKKVYFCLRYWLLMKGMRLTPANEARDMAIANDLFSLTMPEDLTSAVQGYRCIILRAIESSTTVRQNDFPLSGESTEWTVVYRSLDLYLDSATSMIEEFSRITHPSQIGPNGELCRRGGKVYMVDWVFYDGFGQCARDLLRAMAPVLVSGIHVLICEILLPLPGTEKLEPALLGINDNPELTVEFWSEFLQLRDMGLHLAAAQRLEKPRKARLEIERLLVT
ncbi:MAG: hypothetical protein Q9210_006631 [Variospora velana]